MPSYSGWNKSEDAEGPVWTYKHPILIEGTLQEVSVHVWSRHFPNAEREPETEHYAEIHVHEDDHLSMDLDQQGNTTGYPGDGLESQTKAVEACRNFLRNDPGPATIRDAINAQIDDGSLTQEAYDMGREDAPDDLEAELDVDGYTQSSQWSNHVLPKLRKLANFQDKTGAGTYTYPPSGDNEYLLEELVNEYLRGMTENA